MDVKNKAKIFRGLKLVSYCAGLPLMLFYVWKETQGMAHKGFDYALIIWAIVTLAQIVCSFVFKKNNYRRPYIASIVLAVALICTICTPMIIDVVYGAKLAKINENERYVNAGLADYTYEDLLLNYASISRSSRSITGSFNSVYNLNGGDKGGNIISKTDDGEDCDAQWGNGLYGYAKYNPNGLLGDGYVFTTSVAAELLKQYYTSYDALLKKYGSEEAVKAAYIAALNDARHSSDYIDYMNDDEIKAYLAEAARYDLINANSSARLDAVLNVVGRELGAELRQQVSGLLGLVNAVVPVDSIVAQLYGFTKLDDKGETVGDPDAMKASAKYIASNGEYDIDLAGAINILLKDLLNEKLSLSGLESQLYKTIEDLYEEVYVKLQRGINYFKDETNPVTASVEINSVKQLVDVAGDIITTLGLGIDLPAVLQDFLGAPVTEQTTVVQLLAAVLSKLGFELTQAPAEYTLNSLVTEVLQGIGIYPYQHPMVNPLCYYIEDETMRTYAYALYEGQVHGAFCGSVLIGDTLGSDTPGDKAFSLADIERMQTIDAFEADMSIFYDIIALRVMLVKYAALIIVSLILVNVFGYFEDKQMAILVEGEYDDEEEVK